MVAGFHLMFTAYGWWLPNDPRGSSSHEVRVDRVGELGPMYNGRKLVQPSGPELREFYDEAKRVLTHALLRFDEGDVLAIANSFGGAMDQHKYTCYACAVMGDHVHLLIRKHKHHAETMIENLQTASREALISTKRRPTEHPVWGNGPGWKRFLYTEADIRGVIRYIEQNPVKAGRPVQLWPFVKVYDGWLPGRGGAKR